MHDFVFGLLVGSIVTMLVCRWIMAVNNDYWKAINQRAIKMLAKAADKIEMLERRPPADPADWWKDN